MREEDQKKNRASGEKGNLRWVVNELSQGVDAMVYMISHTPSPQWYEWGRKGRRGRKD
jgi:hypothetical protein